MKGLTTLVISMSTNLNVQAYNDILWNCVESSNDDLVSVEELDWSAESQVPIPAEHFWCDFKCRPWAKHSHQTPMTCTFIIWTKVLAPPSLEEKKALPNCGNKDGNIINVVKYCISTSVATVLKCMKWLYPYVPMSLVFGDESLAQGLHLKSHQKCSAGIRTWLSADQSRFSTLTESSFLFDPCLIHRDTVMLE